VGAISDVLFVSDNDETQPILRAGQHFGWADGALREFLPNLMTPARVYGGNALIYRRLPAVRQACGQSCMPYGVVLALSFFIIESFSAQLNACSQAPLSEMITCSSPPCLSGLGTSSSAL